MVAFFVLRKKICQLPTANCRLNTTFAPMSKYLIIVGGATATGKTSMAIELAKHFDTEILSADSRQFYKEMTIGTAKPDAEELAAAKHHFIDSLSVKDEYSVGDFERDALSVLDSIFEKKDVAVMAGGSGFFIRAVCEGLDKFPNVPDSVREHLNDDFEKNGIAFLQNELAEKDPQYFEVVDKNNPVRLIRALSVIRVSGQPFSSFLNQEKPARPFTPIYVLLEMPREKLYERINHRVDLMMENGLLEEAKKLHPFKDLTSLQTVGYQELMRFFDENWTLEKAVEMIKQNSRRYAKRQMTWFRKRPHWSAFQSSELEKIIAFVEEKMKKNIGSK